MVSRETKDVIIAPSGGVCSEEILKRAIKNVEYGARIYHDDYASYNILDGFYSHESVNHSAREYVKDGNIHTNTVEGELSVFRPWLATYRGVSKERLYLYCSHYQFLRNSRRMDRVDRALSMFGLSINTLEQHEPFLSDAVPLLPVTMPN